VVSLEKIFAGFSMKLKKIFLPHLRFE